jgi:hypothetical protein
MSVHLYRLAGELAVQPSVTASRGGACADCRGGGEPVTEEVSACAGEAAAEELCSCAREAA